MDTILAVSYKSVAASQDDTKRQLSKNDTLDSKLTCTVNLTHAKLKIALRLSWIHGRNALEEVATT